MIQPADRLNQVSEYYFSKKLEQIRVMRTGGQDVINLGIGSPDLAPSQAALNAATSAMNDERNHGYASYRSSPELRQAMAEFYQRIYGVVLNPETQILPLLGSKEGILYLSMAYLNPGDGVLIPDPGYPAYASVASLIGARPLVYELRKENGWLPDLNELKKRDLSGVKLMWINYPHMPTGTPGSAQLLQELADFAREKAILLCNDNPYGLVLNAERPRSLLSADPALSHCVELNSLSKSFNMAGWRVGMMLASAPVIQSVLAVKSNVDSGMFIPVQKGAIEALGASEAWHEERNRMYAERRQFVWKIFDRLGFSYSKDQVGLFVWAEAPANVKDIESFVDELLIESNVFLTPGFIFGAQGKRFARASLCVPKERIQEALTRVERFRGVP